MDTTGEHVNVDDLNEDFVAKLLELITAAAADGVTLTVASGFRDTAHQEAIFLERYEEDPSGAIEWGGRKWTIKEEYRGRPAAPPGESLHNHGYAVDFSNAQPGTPAANWLIANVERFGLRTYAQGGEPGHVAPADITHVSQIPEAPDAPAGSYGWDDVLQLQSTPPVEGSRVATRFTAGTGSYADVGVEGEGPGARGGPARTDPVDFDAALAEAQAAIAAAQDGLLTGEVTTDTATSMAAAQAALDALTATSTTTSADAVPTSSAPGGSGHPAGGGGFMGGVVPVDEDDGTGTPAWNFTGGAAVGSGATNEYGFGFPAGGRLYSIGDTRFLVYEVSDAANPNSASAYIYYEVTTPEDEMSLGPPMGLSADRWASISADFVNGGEAEVLLTAEYIGRSWGTIINDIMAGAMNMAGTDATTDSGIMRGLAELIANPDMGEAEQQALWIGTDWWDAHTQKQLAWNDYGTAEKNLLIEEAATNLLTVYEYYTGVPADTTGFYDADGQFNVTLLEQRSPELYQHAFDLASGAATQVGLVGSWIKPAAVLIDQSPHNRRLEEELRLQGMRDMGIAAARSSVADLYETYGLRASNYTIDTVVNKLYMNQMSLDEIETTVKNHSLAKYPHKPLDMDWATYADPYQDAFSSLLEMPRPGFQDPTLAQYLQAPVVDGAEVPNVYEFERKLRQDPRWENTKNAKDAYSSAFGQIGRLMGFG